MASKMVYDAIPILIPHEVMNTSMGQFISRRANLNLQVPISHNGDARANPVKMKFRGGKRHPEQPSDCR